MTNELQTPGMASSTTKLYSGPLTLTDGRVERTADGTRYARSGQRDSGSDSSRMASARGSQKEVEICMAEALKPQGFIMKSEPLAAISYRSCWNLRMALTWLRCQTRRPLSTEGARYGQEGSSRANLGAGPCRCVSQRFGGRYCVASVLVRC